MRARAIDSYFGIAINAIVPQSEQRGLWIEALKEAAKPPAEPIVPDDVRIPLTSQNITVFLHLISIYILPCCIHHFDFVSPVHQHANFDMDN